MESVLEMGGANSESSLDAVEETPFLQNRADVLSNIRNAAEEIVRLIGMAKSVTRDNKKKIVELASAIVSDSKIIPPPPPSSPPPPPPLSSLSVNKEITAAIRQVIKEEMKALKPSYAQKTASSRAATSSANTSATAPKANKPTTKPAIIISTKKETQTRQEIVEAWRKSVSFKASSFAPVRMLPLSNNKLKIEFDTPAQRDETLIRANVTNSEVKAEVAKKRRPMIMLKGITKDTKSEELVSIMRNQNQGLVSMTEEDLALKFVRRNKNENLYNAVLSVNSNVFHAFTSAGRVAVDHQRVHVEEFFAFLQCYRCLQFGHPSTKCTEAVQPCSHCAATDHRFRDCKQKENKRILCCYNCKIHNNKFDTNRSTLHTATSDQCPSVKSMKKRTIENTDYGL